ncbi:MAG: sigma-70 family RNA polymerase sigma factor, partial [Gemmatimonadetes bacterium]
AFSTFAAPRIRGAILDDLRRRDHVPRSTRRRQREMARAREELAAALTREPSDEELAEALGIDLETLWSWKQDCEQAGWLSLDQPLDSREGRSMRAQEILPGEDGEEIEEELNIAQEADVLREEILKLNEQERTVLSLYYFEELKLREIAEVLGVTESRISQIRWKAIKRLRERMGHLREGATP